MRKDAWLTYNRNQNRLAIRKRSALGSRKVKMGLVYAPMPIADRVIYCSACRAPVVNDEIGRRRHSLKNAACAAAMKETR